MRLPRRLRGRGFVGPRYDGLRGRLRFIAQVLLYRTEVVLQASRSDPPFARPGQGDMKALWLTRYEELQSYREQIEREYHEGFLDSWRGPFEWGERVALALVDERVVAFVWAQPGSADGGVCRYGPVLEHECRLLRMGVVPALRGNNYLARFLAVLLPQLYAQGYDHLYSEVGVDNEPSLKAHLRVGFRPIGLVGVTGRLLGGRAVVWKAISRDAQARFSTMVGGIMGPSS